MSLKDNFNQALREVLHKDGIIGNKPSPEEKKKTELDSYLEPAPKKSIEDAAPAEKPAETAAPAETTAKESVNIFGINFEPEDYTLESAFDDDCSEIAALLDIF